MHSHSYTLFQPVSELHGGMSELLMLPDRLECTAHATASSTVSLVVVVNLHPLIISQEIACVVHHSPPRKGLDMQEMKTQSEDKRNLTPFEAIAGDACSLHACLLRGIASQHFVPRMSRWRDLLCSFPVSVCPILLGTNSAASAQVYTRSPRSRHFKRFYVHTSDGHAATCNHSQKVHLDTRRLALGCMVFAASAGTPVGERPHRSPASSSSSSSPSDCCGAAELSVFCLGVSLTFDGAGGGLQAAFAFAFAFGVAGAPAGSPFLAAAAAAASLLSFLKRITASKSSSVSCLALSFKRRLFFSKLRMSFATFRLFTMSRCCSCLRELIFSFRPEAVSQSPSPSVASATSAAAVAAAAAAEEDPDALLEAPGSAAPATSSAAEASAMSEAVVEE